MPQIENAETWPAARVVGTPGPNLRWPFGDAWCFQARLPRKQQRFLGQTAGVTGRCNIGSTEKSERNGIKRQRSQKTDAASQVSGFKRPAASNQDMALGSLVISLQLCYVSSGDWTKNSIPLPASTPDFKRRIDHLLTSALGIRPDAEATGRLIARWPMLTVASGPWDTVICPPARILPKIKSNYCNTTIHVRIYTAMHVRICTCQDTL